MLNFWGGQVLQRPGGVLAAPHSSQSRDNQLREGEASGVRPHLDSDASVHRFTVLFEEQLQPLSGHSCLPAAEHTQASLCGWTDWTPTPTLTLTPTSTLTPTFSDQR